MFNVNEICVKRGEIYYANLDGAKGSEEKGIRPVLIIQNDIGNKYSNTTIVAPITSKINKTKLPTHIIIKNKILLNSLVMLEQIRTLDKNRLGSCIGNLDCKDMEKVNECIKISLCV